MLQEKVQVAESVNVKPKKPIHAIIKKLLRDLYHSSPLSSCADNRKAIVDATTAMVLRSMQFFVNLQALLDNSIFFNTEVRVGVGAKRTREQLRLEECRLLAAGMTAVEIPPPDLLGYNVLALPPAEMKEVIKAKFQRWLLDVGGLFEKLIETRIQQKFYGRAEVHEDDPTVARYWFGRNVAEHGRLDLRQSRTVKSDELIHEADAPYTKDRSWRDVRVKREVVETTTDYVLRRLHGWHLHEIYDLKWHPIPASAVPQPEFISRQIQLITDPIFRDNIKVLAGEMAKETITERDIGEKRWSEVTHEEVVTEEIVKQGRLGSPALCLGDLVLSGWSGTDLSPQQLKSFDKPSSIFDTLENLFGKKG